MSGRHRKPGPRELSGRPQRAIERDYGTKESQAYRTYLASGRDGADPNQTSYPLGILRTNGIITQEQHNAGCKYSWLYCAVNGRVSIAALNFDKLPQGKASNDWPPDWADREFRVLRHYLKGLGMLTKSVIDGACVFERPIPWLFPHRPNHADKIHADMLISGLESLSKRTLEGVG